MGQRRMFSLKIINSARFLKMPIDSQNLYFHLGLHADDDGIVEAYPVMKILGSNEDNLKVLVAKGLIKILNEDLISFITDWQEHNLIRADRKVDSIYKHLLLRMIPEIELLEPKPRADTKQLTGMSSGIPDGRPLDAISKVKLSKVKLSKDDIAEASSAFSLKEELNKLKTDKQRHIQLIGEYLEEKGVQIENYAQLKVAIKRHLRAAVDLAKFSDKQIGEATKIAEKEYPDYTLETLVKIATR